MSDIDSSMLLRCLKGRIGFDHSFTSEAVCNSQERTMNVQQYSFADNHTKNRNGQRWYDWGDELRYKKKPITYYYTGEFIRFNISQHSRRLMTFV